MLKMKSILNVPVNGREFEFSCSPDSPLPDALEANNQINAFLLGRIEQAKSAQEIPEPPEMQPITDEVKQG